MIYLIGKLIIDVDFCVSLYSGFRRLKEDQLPRLIAKIEESFPKYAKDEKHVQKIVEIVNSCVYDERLVSLTKIVYLQCE